MNMRRLILLAMIGIAAPILAHAGDFSAGGAAAFAQNIVEPATLFPAGGDPLPDPPSSAASDFGHVVTQSSARSTAPDVSVDPDSGQLADTANLGKARVGAGAAEASARSGDPPIEPLDAGKRPSYRWQSLVPGVLK